MYASRKTLSYTLKMANRAFSQTTDQVMLVRPSCFTFNTETAADNKFQSQLNDLEDSQVQEAALKEFNALVSKLSGINVSMTIFEDEKVSSCAVFPNNWISFHSNENNIRIAIYPMLSDQRKLERSTKIIKHWQEKLQATVVDYTHFESRGQYLEGTGSMVLDRKNRIAYACTSPRTDAKVLEQFCSDFGYNPILFKAQLSAQDGLLYDVYHTNVMMSIGEGFALVCLESIQNESERETVVKSLKSTCKEIVVITAQQVNEFAGNVLQLAGRDGSKHLLMSTRAYASFTSEQLAVFQRHSVGVVTVPLDVIERVGGGGVRCMIAEVFPPLLE